MNINLAAPFKRQTMIVLIALLLCCALLVPTRQAQKRQPAAKKPATDIDDKALRQADARPGDWITHGRTYSEARHSPLKRIDAANVQRLGLAWSFDTQTNRGLEATPIVVDGVMYTTGSWSVVYALDAKTGGQWWKYDPQVAISYGARACCDVVNRGVAVYKGKVYVGALDGRLIALDAVDGKVVWQVTTVDQNQPYTITGAPRVVKGKVIIGNGGGEYGVRGYVTAYDAETGRQAWRFYTVPGDPSKPFESPALEKAAKTWTGQWWKMGGGGTVWDSLAYDPDLDLLYVGTGNGSPWNQQIRSPQGGDNLYLSCILALRPDTGELVWHYQGTPGDTWDYTATQHMILADLNIEGRARKVLMQAPKNGFFYVLDRATGELISAEPYVEITWAKGIDKKTGRPVENPAARYKTGFSVQKPGPLGGHNWMPMSFNPQTGLVYIPAQDFPGLYTPDAKFKYRPGAWNTGVDFSPMKDAPPSIPPGHLLAWDPVAQKERWRAQYKMAWNSGTLTTAGNLVFQGTSDGRLVAYSADKGEKLWESPLGVGVIGSPMTYEIDGVQYVSVMAGWGGAFALVGGYALTDINTQNVGRLLTFALDAKQPLAALPKRSMAEAPPIESNASPEMIDKGGALFTQWCAVCHGVGAVGGGGLITALPMSKPEVFKMYKEIVLEGDYSSRGMPAFGKWLGNEDVEAIRAYILKRRADLAAGR
ncbi:MAG TPA: PQQ-dependent dehydrogenase, methanol/ethanol family [Blastocatellia bacterium]|nr:PQQ-dependent dehydrogenase, methanol/ethanol family [Blastocatellia bacterium]